jgi:glycosyltransferase involved in cell wall biosynthesis
MLLREPRSLYAAFDRFPTRKGASTHIARFAPALFEAFGAGVLVALGDDKLPAHQLEDDAEIVRYCAPHANFLERALGYGAMVAALLERHAGTLACTQFRDPWSGVPLLDRPRAYACVYEVNALPSIELPHAFPAIAPRTLAKLRDAERFCLESCDRIVTPSRTTAALLAELGIDAGKIRVVPNGADVLAPQPRPADAPAAPYLLYFGALQSWQGVDTLLRAFARLADLDLHLVICGSARSRDARRYERFAAKLGLEARITWRWSLESRELAGWLANAALTVAPLKDCARNVEQGCAPLKILESLAAGVPVVASDLPPVREIVTDGVEGRLVAPDRPAELARAIRILLAYPQRSAQLGANARARIARELTWDHSLAALRDVYSELQPEPARSAA